MFQRWINFVDLEFTNNAIDIITISNKLIMD